MGQHLTFIFPLIHYVYVLHLPDYDCVSYVCVVFSVFHCLNDLQGCNSDLDVFHVLFSRHLRLKVDMFSYGMVLYELLSGRRPSLGQHQLQIAKKLSKGVRPVLGSPEEVQFCCLHSMLIECWDTKPEKVRGVVSPCRIKYTLQSLVLLSSDISSDLKKQMCVRRGRWPCSV